MAQQVKAAIVVSQVGNPAGGYVSGTRDNLTLDNLITLANLDDTGVKYWIWTVSPRFGKIASDLSFTAPGAQFPTLLATSAGNGWGDTLVTLTAIGDALPNGSANQAVARALLGVRAPFSGYAPGMPIPHPAESDKQGASITFDTVRGGAGRIEEALIALKSAPGGGGGAPTGAAGGDLGGIYPNPVVARLDTVQSVATTGGSTTLNATQYSAVTVAVSGALTSNASIVFPLTLNGNAGGMWYVPNNTAGAFTLTVIGPTGTGVTIGQGTGAWVRTDGVNFYIAAVSSVVAGDQGTTRINVPNAAGTYDTPFVAPAGALIERILFRVEIGGQFSNADTLTVGTPASPGAFVAAADLDGATPGQFLTNGGVALTKPKVKAFESGDPLGATAIRIVKTGTSAGTAYVLVRWSIPHF